MEVCPPGTDDGPIKYSTLNKQETERARLLSQQGFLKDGEYDNIFVLKIENGNENWYCNMCQCPINGRVVYQHEWGKRHIKNLSKRPLNWGLIVGEPVSDEELVSPEVAPTESLPGGFEKIGRVTDIQDRLDAFTLGPLVALEYLLELKDNDQKKEPEYLCVLCSKKGDPRTVITHLSSSVHIAKYLKRHFATCWTAIAPYKTKNNRINWQTTVQKIAEGIEKQFGRLKPFSVNKTDFENDKYKFIDMIENDRMHFSEISGFTFEDLVIPDELTKAVPGDKPSETPSKKKKKKAETIIIKPEPVNLEKGDLRHYLSRPPVLYRVEEPTEKSNDGQLLPERLHPLPKIKSSVKRKSPSPKRKSPSPKRRSPSPKRKSPSPKRRSPSPKRKSPVRRRSPSSRRKSPIRRRSPSPKRRSPIDKNRQRNLRKMEKFKNLERTTEDEMLKVLKEYQACPEKHPQYNEEWQKFWSHRRKELKATGSDETNYNYTPEWVVFWTRRMVELHNDELRNRKEALRKKFDIPEELKPVKFKIGSSVTVDKGLHKQNVVIDDDKYDKSRKRLSSSLEDARSNNTGDLFRKLVKISPSAGSRKSQDKSPVGETSGGSVKTSLSKFIEHLKSKETVTSSNVSSSPNRNRSRSRERSRERKKSKERSFERSAKGEERNNLSPIRNRSRSRERSRERKKSKERPFERSAKGEERNNLSPIRNRSRSRERRWERKRLKESSIERNAKVYKNRYSRPHKKAPSEDDDDDDDEINVVDVLRILTALEDHLGSLGPKIVDLLRKSLTLEKNEANSSEQLLDNDVHCMLLETAKEKLKGLMLAGLVDHIHQKAFKRVIKKVGTLMRMSGQRKRMREKMLLKFASVNASSGVNVTANQVTNAVSTQQKTDVIHPKVVAMSEQSTFSSKPDTGPENNSTKVKNIPDDDLQILLLNFKDLSTEEQLNLIRYLKMVEYSEPERVERLREFVHTNAGRKSKNDTQEENKSTARSKSSEREPPVSHNLGGVIRNEDDSMDLESDDEKDETEIETDKYKSDKKVKADSEEDVYNFDNVVKTVSKNLQDKERVHQNNVLQQMIKNHKSKLNSSTEQPLLSDLMNNISRSNPGNSNAVDLLGFGKAPVPNPPSANMANVDLSKFDAASLAFIVNTVKNMSSNQAVNKQLAFKPPSSVRNDKLSFDGGPNRLNVPGRSDYDRTLDSGAPDGFALGFDRFGGPNLSGSGGPNRFGLGGSNPVGTVDPGRFEQGDLGRFNQGGPQRSGPMFPGLGGPGPFHGGADILRPGLDRLRPTGPGILGPGGPNIVRHGGPHMVRPGELGMFRLGGPGVPVRNLGGPGLNVPGLMDQPIRLLPGLTNNTRLSGRGAPNDPKIGGRGGNRRGR